MEYLTMVQMTLSAKAVVSKTMQNSLKMLNMNEGKFIFEKVQTLCKYLTSSVTVTDRTFNPFKYEEQTALFKDPARSAL
jgi:hypothetical protein